MRPIVTARARHGRLAPGHPRGVLAAGFAGTLALLAAAGSLGADVARADVADPNLDQDITAGQDIVHGERVLTAGHVDMGPRFVAGEWTFLVHDDVAKADASATSVWRYPDETVLHVLDAGELTVPDDPAYEFLGPAPGETVWVVPQTQHPDVVWLGWNTQDPEVMRSIDRGITLTLTGVQGPGAATVYLQSGSFGEPEVLWDSRNPEEQAVWVDVNTHTHANWVFTEPGVYLVRVRAEADLVDGSHVSDTQVLRIAVGTATSADDALAARWSGPTEAPGADGDGAQDAPVAESSSDGSGGRPDGDAPGPGAVQAAQDGAGQGLLVPVLVGAIVLVAVGLIVGFTVAVVRGNRARRRVLAARAQAARDEGGAA